MARFCAAAVFLFAFPLALLAAPPEYDIELANAGSGFDGKMCWVHARAGAIPAKEVSPDAKHPLVVMTMQKLLLSGSDVFYAIHDLRSADLGDTWTVPVEQAHFGRQVFKEGEPLPTGAETGPHYLKTGEETTVCDYVPQWHAATKTLLGTGSTVWYRNNKVTKVRPRGVSYSTYDLASHTWRPWQTLKMPDEPQYVYCGAGSGQRCDLENGEVLLPVSFRRVEEKSYNTTVCRCAFDGKTLRFFEHGSAHTVEISRGLYEPSITKFGDRFFVTMRNDKQGYVMRSGDGLHYEEPRPWTFDDGKPIGNYNTQQHWVTHSDGLFLIYTRRGANNNHVFRHRAPLFIAQVDPERLCLLRATEKILIPERGARLGNFGVVDVSPHETWVTAAEWMQPATAIDHGSDNTIWLGKIKWKTPNKRME